MDILHFLKTQHDLAREVLTRVEQADGIKARRHHLDDLTKELTAHLMLEKDYLYPELAGLFAGADALVTVGLANGALIGRRLKTLVKLAGKSAAEQDGYDKRLAELRESMLKHFDLEEQTLMPKVRALIRTEDREDLGQVFAEAKVDLLGEAEPEPLPTSSRKRA